VLVWLPCSSNVWKGLPKMAAGSSSAPRPARSRHGSSLTNPDRFSVHTASWLSAPNVLTRASAVGLLCASAAMTSLMVAGGANGLQGSCMLGCRCIVVGARALSEEQKRPATALEKPLHKAGA
jgi:hypothetical protein